MPLAQLAIYSFFIFSLRLLCPKAVVTDFVQRGEGGGNVCKGWLDDGEGKESALRLYFHHTIF